MQTKRQYPKYDLPEDGSRGKQARKQLEKVVDAEKVIARSWRAREQKKEDRSWQSVARELFFQNAGAKGHLAEPDWVRFLKLFSLEHPDLSLHFKKRCGRSGTSGKQRSGQGEKE